MNTTSKLIQQPLNKHIKNVFTINYGKYRYYQPNIVQMLQSRISNINVSNSSYKQKLNVIYSVLLDHLSKIFFNSSMYLSKLSPLTNSTRNYIYLNNMDIFILGNTLKRDNKYKTLIEKQQIIVDITDVDKRKKAIRVYSILCDTLNINKNDITSIMELIKFTITNNGKHIVFYRTDGAYQILQKTVSKKTSTLKHIIFKIYAFDSFCSLIYSVENNQITFLYSDYDDSKISFSNRILFILSKTLFKLDVTFISLNLKNIDDEQFEDSYMMIKDIKIWICIFLLKLAPTIDVEDILEYINLLPYQLRDILYINILQFIFEQSGNMTGQSLDYSDLIQEMIDQETTHITGIPLEHTSNIQSGGAIQNSFINKTQNTNQLIRNLFFIQ